MLIAFGTILMYLAILIVTGLIGNMNFLWLTIVPFGIYLISVEKAARRNEPAPLTLFFFKVFDTKYRP